MNTYKDRLHLIMGDMDILMFNIINEIGDLNDNLPENKAYYDLLSVLADVSTRYDAYLDVLEGDK